MRWSSWISFVGSRLPNRSRTPTEPVSEESKESALSTRSRVLFVTHDGYRAGAPILLLDLLRWLKQNTHLDFEVLMKDDGELRGEFESLARVCVYRATPPGPVTELAKRVGAAATLARRVVALRQMLRSRRLLRRYRRERIGLVYSNTITNGEVLRDLEPLDIPVICHVHELEFWIKYRVPSETLPHVLKHTTRYIAVSGAVKRCLEELLGVPAEKIEVVHEFVKVGGMLRTSAGASTRESLGIPNDSVVVGGSGTTDWRKSPELFVQLARAVHELTSGTQPHFVWVGGESSGPAWGALWHDITRLGLERYVHFVGVQVDPRPFFEAFDIFTLVSREDPFPLVALEAAALGVPVICFDRAGGAPELVEEDAGIVVPYLDVPAMARAVTDLIASPERRRALGERAASKVRARHDVEVQAPRIAEIVGGLLERSKSRRDSE
jgi:glycosyltransferase involved in cell wall biosynthesis